jgi:hypothetical protein
MAHYKLAGLRMPFFPRCGAGFREACSIACQGLRALDDWAGLGGHGDEVVAGTDAYGTGWTVHERTSPGPAAGAGDGDSRGRMPKAFQPISRRSGRLGGTSFAWLHERYLPGGQAILHDACGLIVHYA